MSEKQFKVVVLPMSWLEWNETGMLREHFPNINLIEGRDEPLPLPHKSRICD